MTQITDSQSFLPRSCRVALVRTDRVGTAVTTLLQQQGHSVVGVSSHVSASAKRAGECLNAPLFRSCLPNSDVVLLGIPGAAITRVVKALTDFSNLPPVIIHFAGAYGIGPLLPAVRLGVAGYAMHPVQTCPDVDATILRLPGSAWRLTYTNGVEEWAQSLVSEDLKRFPVKVAEEHRPIWHAAAAVTSTGIATMMGSGEPLLASIGVENPTSILQPLAAATLASASEYKASGPVMTGPAI